MILPSPQEIAEVCELLNVGDYNNLIPDKKVMVVDLAIKAKAVQMIDDIGADTQKMADWFKNSKLWDGF